MIYSITFGTFLTTIAILLVVLFKTLAVKEDPRYKRHLEIIEETSSIILAFYLIVVCRKYIIMFAINFFEKGSAPIYAICVAGFLALIIITTLVYAILSLIDKAIGHKFKKSAADRKRRRAQKKALDKVLGKE